MEVSTMKKLLVITVSLLAILSLTNPAMASERTLWQQTKTGASSALEWTVTTSGKVWAATKEHASSAAAWTSDKASKGWDSTKEGVSDAAKWTGEKSRAGWQYAKNETGEISH
jgi:hypothetical protein